MTITKIKNANVEMDEYEVIALVNKDMLEDFIDLIKNEIKQWGQVEVIVLIRRLICTIEGK